MDYYFSEGVEPLREFAFGSLVSEWRNRAQVEEKRAGESEFTPYGFGVKKGMGSSS
jgi:hypothetical protein